jgi:hypothetical protein
MELLKFLSLIILHKLTNVARRKIFRLTPPEKPETALQLAAAGV